MKQPIDLKVSFRIVCIIIVINTIAQNLVPNPGFCAIYNLSPVSSIYSCKYWRQYTKASTGYYHAYNSTAS
jgi:hypothetical protein